MPLELIRQTNAHQIDVDLATPLQKMDMGQLFLRMAQKFYENPENRRKCDEWKRKNNYQ